MEKLKVLVVDDDKSFREMLEEFLLTKDYDVTLAADGKEAIQKVNEAPPELILCDLKMPEMNGLEVLTLVKKTHPEITFIMMTAYGDMSTWAEALGEGAYEFINKPFLPEEMHLLIQKSIAKKQ